MNILNTFGFQPVLFLAQLVNFLILVYVFKRFLYKPILKTLQERRRVIAKGITDAQDAAKEKAEAEAKKAEAAEAAKAAEEAAAAPEEAPAE